MGRHKMPAHKSKCKLYARQYHFEFIVGKPYDELEKENKELLETLGFEKDDISDIVYPNAIQKIADLSIVKNENSRNITKEEMLQYLRMIKTAAITRWTRSLSNYEDVIKRHDADKETAERMIKDGEMSLEKIARYIPSLSMDELKEIEAEVMQLT